MDSYEKTKQLFDNLLIGIPGIKYTNTIYTKHPGMDSLRACTNLEFLPIPIDYLENDCLWMGYPFRAFIENTTKFNARESSEIPDDLNTKIHRIFKKLFDKIKKGYVVEHSILPMCYSVDFIWDIDVIIHLYIILDDSYIDETYEIIGKVYGDLNKINELRRLGIE